MSKVWIAGCILAAGIFLLVGLSYVTGRIMQKREAGWLKDFSGFYFAHRGLFDNREIPENSIPAFQKAVECGYGIELDVQLTKDGKPVIFHDASLLRICGVDKSVTECTYEELCAFSLLDTDLSVPLLDEVLVLVGGRVPLIVEIKSSGDVKKTSETVAAKLKGYSGLFCIESFHPAVPLWFRKYCPQVICGRLSTDTRKDGLSYSVLERWVLLTLITDLYTRPAFLAFNQKHAKRLSYRLCRCLYPVANVAWTVRSKEQQKEAQKEFSLLIFDSYRPDK